MGQRRRQRFSDLERQFRESGGVAAPGSRLAGYIDFKQGKSQIKVTQKLTSAQRKRFGFGVLPFNLAVDTTTPERYTAPITAYSNGIRAEIGLTNTNLGYVNIDGTTVQSENFYPALLRVFIPTAGATPLTPISAITKKEYTRTPGRSGSIPFGRAGGTPGTDVEETRRADLATAAKNNAGVKATSVSYDPEVFKVGKPDLVSPA